MASEIRRMGLLISRDLQTSQLLTLRSFLTPLSFPFFYLYVGGVIYSAFITEVAFGGISVSYPTFLATGLVVIQVYQGANVSTSMLWTDIRSNMLAQLKYMGVGSSTYFASKVVATGFLATIYGIFFFVLTAPLVLYFGLHLAVNPLGVVEFFVGILAAGVFFISLYFLVASITKDQASYYLILTPTLFPIMFLSDAFYPTASVPQPWSEVFYWNPLSIFCRVVRSAMLLGTLDSFDLAVGIGLATVALAVSAFAFGRKFPKL